MERTFGKSLLGPFVLRHGDWRDANILVDFDTAKVRAFDVFALDYSSSAQVTGIIDWEFACGA